MKKFPKVNIVSTLEDTQGEKRSKQDIEGFFNGLPARMPLGIAHDMTRTGQSYIDNFEIIPVDGVAGEWKLVGDLWCAPEDKDELLEGISITYVSMVGSNCDEPLVSLLLPFPFYNNDDLSEEILKCKLPLSLGKLHKKEMSPEAVGMIFSLVILGVSPLWNDVYNSQVKPHLEGVISFLKSEAPEELHFDYVQNIRLNENGADVQILFLSKESDWSVALEPSNIQRGLVTAFDFLRNNDVGKMKEVFQLRLLYDEEDGVYLPHMIHYSDGEHLTLN